MSDFAPFFAGITIGPMRCRNCGAPITFWRDEGWVHDDRVVNRPYCENPEGSVLR